MSFKTVTINDAAEAVILTLQARTSDIAENSPSRNFDAVQPPGSNVQGAFGSGLYQAGVLEREFALCGVDEYTTLGHAKAAVDTALLAAYTIRVDGWALRVLAASGAVDYAPTRGGIRVRLRFIPRSPHWKYLTGGRAGSMSQSGTTITREASPGPAFEADDVGRVITWYDTATFSFTGREALITSVTSANVAETDIVQDVPLGSTFRNLAATGLL